ncbi:alpha/beta fold hydrolase [Sphingomonas immobilis]|uniref:Palmitoyl-protein thioesterase ABHD10, mitochondrial n=1 Tax=Sphingomonas immobilis TaxID=3063997 RepID=A0ABT9A3S7_9SPHN|nr:alpha/beta hydrolase [Sphingomonas sp. CA1-15]MDO7844496.1 alpha/beta hydrolase [Sphingomonas sp. CA1-15]
MTDPRPKLAYHLTPGTRPAVVFLPGYASDMTGGKATAIEAWAKANGRACLRFDYAGCGASEGDFEDQSLAGWRDDVLAMIALIDGPVILVGSSMGGWLMLLVARDHPAKVAGLVGIAAAPDFTDWGFTVEEKLAILSEGRIERPSDDPAHPMVYTRAFWASGEANRLMFGPIAIDVPVRLIHGMGDVVVPWNRSLRLAELIRSPDVQVTLVKDGDHRLSREGDIARLLSLIEDIA